MSKTLGEIRGRPNPGPYQGPGLRDLVHVNRFHGGGDGTCSQVTIGGHYVQLDQEGIRRLRKALKKAIR